MNSHRRNESGQILPIFVIFLTVMLAGTGLVVDVGGAWGQQRQQQKVADAAALAGATAEANGAMKAGIIAAAVANAESNGYSASEVTVNIPPSGGAYAPGGSQSGPLSTNDCSGPDLYPCWVEVIISRQHANSFATIVGQSSWNVTARGVAVGGIANAVSNGLAPMMFSYHAVEPAPGYDPGALHSHCDPQNTHCPPVTTFPLTRDQFNWTTFCSNHPENCNVDANTAKTIIEGGNFQAMVSLGMYLGPHNGGQMTAVCSALKNQYPTGGDLPVGVSDDNGNLVGFWMWHFDPTDTECTPASSAHIDGWFVSDITMTLPLTITAGAPPATFGEYIVRLVE